MTINFIHVVCVLNMLCRSSDSSIAGVTYMDHFDFEERYRNVHECDPFYWHPLHLPEDCADMYEKLIRSRLPKNGAFRVLQEKRPIYVDDSFSSEGNYQRPYNFEYTGNYQFYTPNFPYPIKPVRRYHLNREMTPYEKMLESVRRDVSNQPSYPTIQVMPNLGPVALYYQPVSKKSESMIKRLSRTYGGAAREAPVYNSDPSQPDPYDQEGKKNKKEDVNKWQNVVNKVLKNGWTKTENGRFVTLSKTKP